MTIRIVNSVKYIALFSLSLFSIIACEKDFENIGVGLVDNDLFTTKEAIFEVISYNKNVDSSRVDAIPQYLLGVYNDENFGLIKSAFVSQLGIATNTNFGENVSIDAVVLDIPYYATRDGNNDDGGPNFRLDSILGDQEIAYNLSVDELGTFLNILDPLDPTKLKTYYSNEEYIKGIQLYSDVFQPNRNDTVLYVDRRFLDGDPNTVDDVDTIKKSDLAPSIKIPLDTTFFRNNFINQQNTGVFDSFDNFINHFRGLMIEPSGADGSIMTLAMNDAVLNLYYTNDVEVNETITGVDANGDGDVLDESVIVRTKQTSSFAILGQRASTYTRDYSSSMVGITNRFVNPNVTLGEDKLYLQGAAGSISVVELFKGIDLDEIRNENWLINEANLTFYLDETSANNVPEQLLLYRFEDNSQILDVFTEGLISGIGGVLERDADDNSPTKYQLNITDYISEVLKTDEPLALEKLAIKVLHSTDIPSNFVANDTLIKDFSWIAKGVVLKGNNLPGDPKRLKLEIFYTVDNE